MRRRSRGGVSGSRRDGESGRKTDGGFEVMDRREPV